MAEITDVAVVGAGYMGKGIAHTLARGGARVALWDGHPAATAARHAEMVHDVAEAEARGLVPVGSTDTVSARTSAADSLASAVGRAQFVMEVVPEAIAVKHEVLGAIETEAAPDAVIGSNTSAIPISDLGTALTHPERLFGVHWFNPAPFLPAVEVILGETSDPGLLTPVTDLLRAAGKSPVVVADSPGFICNRLQFALFKEAARMVEDGVATAAEIDEVVTSSFGFRLPFFGPFAIADMAGLDVYAGAFATLEEKLGDRFACPPSLRERVRRGDLGTKSGGGYRAIPEEQVTAVADLRDRSYVALSDLRTSLASARPDN